MDTTQTVDEVNNNSMVILCLPWHTFMLTENMADHVERETHILCKVGCRGKIRFQRPIVHRSPQSQPYYSWVYGQSQIAKV